MSESEAKLMKNKFEHDTYNPVNNKLIAPCSHCKHNIKSEDYCRDCSYLYSTTYKDEDTQPRKAIQICAVYVGFKEQVELYVLGDDGSIWAKLPKDSAWTRLPDLPQD